MKTLLKPEQLHSYQIDTVNHAMSNKFSMLLLGIGLGKTISTLTTFVNLRRLSLTGPMLLIAPKRVIQLTWRQEALKWEHTKHLKFSMMMGTPKQRQTALFSKADIYLINYEGLSWLTTQLQHYFINNGVKLPFNMLVLDEISKMKRSESKRFKEFAPITEHFTRRMGLTASPASNGLLNVWSQYFIIDGGERLGTRFETFQQRFFHKLPGEYGKWVNFDDSRDMIVAQTADITIEIAAEGNIDLPKVSIIDVPCVLPPAKMKLYKKLEETFFIELDNGADIEVFNAATLSNKLIQFSNGIVYNYPNPNEPEYRTQEDIHNEKYDALRDIYDDSGDEPILLSYQFSSEKERLLELYPDSECLTGASEEEAISIMERFNAGKIKLLIAHSMSAGHGLNFQGACSIAVWFGIGYNLELYEQFNGRIYRQGQQNHVRIFRILCENTIDQAVAMALENKHDVQQGLKDAINSYRKEQYK